MSMNSTVHIWTNVEIKNFLFILKYKFDFRPKDLVIENIVFYRNGQHI